MKEHVLTTLENSRRYTLAVAEAMPESAYDSKPAEGVWNFRELLNHIAYGIQWWEDNCIKGVKTEWRPPPVGSSKKQAVEYLKQTYDSLQKTVTDSKISDDLLKGFQATLDHITHHRGQAVLYLRSNGIIPPEYQY